MKKHPDDEPAPAKEKAPQSDVDRLMEGLNAESIRKLREYAELLLLGQDAQTAPTAPDLSLIHICIEKDSVVKGRLDKDSNTAAAAGEPDNRSCDVFSTFADGDGELLQALQDYDSMRREKRKACLLYTSHRNAAACDHGIAD